MWSPKVSVFVFIFYSLLQATAFATTKVKSSYIVYLGSHAHGSQVTNADLERVKNSHYNLLGSYLGSKEKAKEAIFYSYKRHINGFAAYLKEEEAAQIAEHPDVVSVFPNQVRRLHTSHSWEFMSLEHKGEVNRDSLWRKARFGEGVIIANLDSGVWPESRSFSDEGFGPVPSRWKGTCTNDSKAGVPCNRKLIGARFYYKGYLSTGGRVNHSDYSPRDTNGHGTHTLSTAGGNFVPGASILGVVNGTIKGGSPKARVAAYKVCWPDNYEVLCADADVLAGFDMAIYDGVDVISVSLGSPPSDYFADSTSIGAFHAVKKGIVVLCSAGNDGPKPGTATNISPWIITVGASTLDREIENFVELHNGLRLKGTSLSKSLPEHRFYPLISGAQAKFDNAPLLNASLCEEGALDPEKVKGKIIACLRGDNARIDKGWQAAQAGAVGMILCNDKLTGDQISSDPHFIPASNVNYADGLSIFAYIDSSNNPQAYITPTTTKLHKKPAPTMATFSSQGPNVITPEILKPDITAPGVDIIASVSEAVPPAIYYPSDTRRTAFNLMSGTSMSCPHVAGVVGLLKTLNPHWSPAAIRSAIMTTARTRDNTRHPMVMNGTFIKATPFNYGSGHIRPNRAMDPGLVYDMKVNDYLDFLCAIGYNQTMISAFSDGPHTCTESGSPLDLNYPSITIPNLSGTVTVTRTLKNVGSPAAYVVRVKAPRGVSVSVKPRMLTFEKIGEEKSFKMSVKAKWRGAVKEEYVFGGLTWTDGKHYVRSPIVVAATPSKN